jgi:radical SAM family uncharacterized protein/radical SAM-linked protein
MLDEILPLVKKPIRYTGGEYNITVKSDPSVHVGIVFPEVYEIGMSNLGIKIIYHLFNREPRIQCERIFAPWPDLAEKMTANGIPLYGLETGRPAGEFDLLGFSLQSEMSYTNVLYALDLAGIPAKSADRDHRHPVLIAGGPCTLNPAPLSAVFDAFVIGDGEDTVRPVADILTAIPRERKAERIQELSRIGGVWVPRIHAAGQTVRKNTVQQLRDDDLPSPAILPICDVTHDRLAVEVMRGCTWGCRFCQAGYVNRPLRIRPEASILRSVEKGIRDTGWEEVALLSFSILDYPDLLNLIRKLNEILKKKNISISLPAMRGELFTEELAVLLKEIKKTGLTFAPEAASEELRKRINKPFSNDRLMSSIRTAGDQGWRQVKLYFMVGLPFEKDGDIDEIRLLMQSILKSFPKGGIKISISSFVPKPHTPFENAEFAPLDILRDKIDRIRRFRKPRVELNYQDPEASYIEAVLSRGDERLFPVIQKVYDQGGRFEEWREGFDFTRWQRAFESAGVDPGVYLKPRDRQPWDFIDTGVKKDFLKEEFNRAQQAVVTGNCYYDNCPECGACDGTMAKHPPPGEKYLAYGRYPKRETQPIAYRIKYSIGESFRYASHLDMTRTIYRALRRSDMPLQFTTGFSPIPRVSFGPPKSVGQVSKCDFFDFSLEAEYFGNISRELNSRFPSGIRILDARAIPANTPSLSSSINLIYYEVSIPAASIKKPFDFDPERPVYMPSKSGMKNVAQAVESISLRDGTLNCGLYYGEKNVNIYELCSYLTDLPLEQVKLYKITRTLMFIKREGLLYSPMEVK